jgi:two-component system cell cycle sensor histidine kinase/response regulator CckA
MAPGPGGGPDHPLVGEPSAAAEAFRQHPWPTWVYDAETRVIVAANEAAAAWYGPDALLALCEGDLRAGPEPSAGRQARGERWHRRRDGRIVAVEVATRPLRWAGRPAVLVAVRERSGAGSAPPPDRNVFDNVKQVIFETDARGRFTFLNAAWADLTGFDVGETLGTSFLGYVHPDDRQAHAELFQPLGERRDDFVGLQARYLTKTGGARWVEVYARLTFDEQGTVRGIFGSLTDVTERRRAEEELREARGRLRHLLGASPAVTYSRAVGPEHAFTFVSENVAELLGYQPHEFLDDPGFWAGRVHPDDLRAVGPELARLPEQGHQSLEYRFRHRAGDYRWVHDERRLVHDAAGAPLEIVGSWLDVTERREAEAVRGRLEGQLRQSQKMEAIGRLAGGIAHDFNNLLTVITGRADLLLRRLGGDNALARDAELILRTAERAASLTRQLLVFSRKQVVEPRIVDLNVVVRNMERMLGRLIGEDVELVIQTAPDLGRVKADTGQLEQVIMNLAVNARDAMPRGGRLVLETANVDVSAAGTGAHGGIRPGRYVMLAVTDTGCGMDAETLSHLFEPFFTTKGPERGTGLGLSTVYGIVKQSEGEIAVESELGRGATFRIYLPRVGDAAPAEEARAGRSRYPRGSETVLLVEDDGAVRKLAREILRISGYTVLEAPEGQAALALAAAHPGPIHLLVTDVVMPGIDGREVAERLLRLHPEARVLFLSGYTDDAIAEHGVAGPGTPLLHKPFSPALLAWTVRAVLDGRPQAPPPDCR